MSRENNHTSQVTKDNKSIPDTEDSQHSFVIGILSNLSEKTNNTSGFLEISSSNFNEVMKSMKLEVTFKVENTLTGKGDLDISLVFENMDDFSPGTFIAQIPTLRKHLETRTRLKNLLTYIDGKVIPPKNNRDQK